MQTCGQKMALNRYTSQEMIWRPFDSSSKMRVSPDLVYVYVSCLWVEGTVLQNNIHGPTEEAIQSKYSLGQAPGE